MVLIDARHDLFPLSLALLGFDLSRLVIVRPASEQDALWACEEALRCDGVGLVWTSLGRLDATSFRRLQLAAEASGGIGFLARSAKARGQPCWAEARLLVRPRPSRGDAPHYRVEVVSRHGKSGPSTADILIDSVRGTIHGSAGSANSLPVVSRMDSPAVARRSTGA